MTYDGPACVKCDHPFKGLVIVWQNESTGQWICGPCYRLLPDHDKAKYGAI